MPPPTKHAVLDVVELLVDSGRWPVGTIGTVVDADDKRALVEISDERGHALDLISVPHDALARPPERRHEALDYLRSIASGATHYDFETARAIHAERDSTRG